MTKHIPTRKIFFFRSCLINVEYPGVESSTKWAFNKLGIDWIQDPSQSCCTGLGYYYDLFDQLSTTTIAARNFWLAKEKTKYENFAVLCSTCYAINKKSCLLLKEKKELCYKVNNILEQIGMKYKNNLDSKNNFFHVVEIFHKVKDKISEFNKYDLSQLRVASHPACHYYKTFSEDAIGAHDDTTVIDDIAESLGLKSINWYPEKILTCGAGFRIRYNNKQLSLEITLKKLKNLQSEGVNLLLHMCPNCQLQYDRYQPLLEKKYGEKFKIYHLNISQLIALVMGADPYKVVGIQTHTVKLEPFLKKNFKKF
ncbi:MAG: CoB--CoM heterodisulfide reductase iron-sulfur subunit B family protein [Candidatus Helarchaeota archaeon]